MKHILALVVALLIALAPLVVAAEPIVTDTADVSPPAPEVTCFESLEDQSSSVTPALYVNESNTNDPWKSDIKVGCDGEYFSESGESVTVTDLGDLGFANTLENGCDSSSWNQSTIDMYEDGYADAEQPGLQSDAIPDGTTTDVILHNSAQSSSIENITVESEHPYANNYTHTWEISRPGAHQMRLHFDKLRLSSGDRLTIYDEMGRELVSYKGVREGTDFWIEWQTTDTFLVELATDSSATSYGFFIDLLERRDEKSPSTEHFAESHHPYANNYVHTWEISRPGAHQVRLHFDKLRLASGDSLTIYDELGKELASYGETYSVYERADFWTEWQTTDTLRIKLSTNNGGTAYGFLIDDVERRDERFPPPEQGHFAESYHPYANNYVHTWEISRPGAHQTRLHFDKLRLASGDSLTIYDELGKELVSYGEAYSVYERADFWTEWQTTDTLRIKLSTNNGGTAYGFLIDDVDHRDEKSPSSTEHFAESYHPYANNYVNTWEVSVPGSNQTRLHFDKLRLAKGDSLTIYNEQGKQLVSYKEAYSVYERADFWTEWQTTDTLRITLSTGNSGTAYGFLVDLIETEDGVFTPSQLPPPTALTLLPGWNFVSVPRPLAEGNDTAAIFTSVDTGGRSILWYDTAAGRWSPFKATDQINLLEGFWIHSNETMTVPLDFSTDPLIPPAERRLSPGWNTVGVTGTIPATARDAFCSVKAQWTTLIGFDAGKQAFEAGIVNDGSGPNVDTRTVRPGKGYWLYMTEPGTLCAIGA